MIEPIYIELDWDYSLGTYNGELEVEIGEDFARFHLVIEASRELIPSTWETPEESHISNITSAIVNLEYYKGETLSEPPEDIEDKILNAIEIL